MIIARLRIDNRRPGNEFYTNNFEGTKLKRNYIWGHANKKRVETTELEASVR